MDSLSQVERPDYWLEEIFLIEDVHQEAWKKKN
jgi:hypothetical protein